MNTSQNSSNADLAGANRWRAMAVLYLASFMNLIDISIVNVALPQIHIDTGATSTQLKWVAEAYVLALAVGLLPFGRFGDVFGRRRIFLWGLTGFTAASVICGLAPNINSLITARAIQGIAAAMMVPQVLAMVHVLFPPDEKARVFGLFGTVSSLGVVAGPVLGGAVISADLAGLGWRPTFLVNLPIGIAALIGAWVWLPPTKPDGQNRPDWIGSLLFAVAIFLLVYPLIEGRRLGWPWWSFTLMISAVPAGLLFAKYEYRRDTDGHSVLLPIGLLANAQYLSRLGLITLFFSGIPGLFLVLALFFQSGFGLTALQSGLVTTPFPVGVMLASMTTQRLGDHFLQGRIACGAGLLVVGMAGLLVEIRSTGALLNTLAFIPPLLICGIGMGSAVMALFQVTMSNVSEDNAGAGSGAMQAFQQIGAALGIAVTGQIFFSLLGNSGLGAALEDTSRYVRAAAWATTYSIFIFAGLTALVGGQAWQKRSAKV